MAPVNEKKREAGKLKKHCLTLDEKIKILDANKKKKMSCRDIAKTYKIGKTQASSLLRDERMLRKEYENFQGKGFKHVNRSSHQKFKPINEVLYSWFKKCEASGIYVNGPLLIEEAMNIKKSLNRPELESFKASNGWLDKWKLSYGIKEKQISGESLEVSTTTIESWIERIQELCKGYDDKDILNMDESGCFFKALPTKGFALKGKKSKGGKKSKQRMTVAFFVSADGGKVGKPIVIWKSKTPRCFKKAIAADTLSKIMYFSDQKSWMQVEIMEKILETLNNQMVKEKRKVILFLDNATVHPPSLVDKYSNIKVVFLPKNTTSRLQPLDAGIIQSFKSKYRMKLMRFVIARTKEDVLASEIAKQVDVLQAIEWVAKAWEEVSTNTIKNCFKKCGFDQNSYGNDDEKILDDEFKALFDELADSSMTPEEYIDFEIETCSSAPAVNADEVDWKVSSVGKCVNEYLRNEAGIEEDRESDESEDEVQEVEVEPEEISSHDALIIIDKLMNLKELNSDERSSLSSIKDKLETVRINCKKQSSIEQFYH